jgi:hypothetical protein
MPEGAASSNQRLPTMTHVEWETTPVSSPTELVRALGRAAWLPTWWPDSFGHPRYLLLRRDGERFRYLVWSTQGSAGLVLASLGHRVPSSERPVEPTLGLGWPARSAPDGADRWSLEMPDGEVLQLVGAVRDGVRDQLVQSLRLVRGDSEG